MHANKHISPVRPADPVCSCAGSKDQAQWVILTLCNLWFGFLRHCRDAGWVNGGEGAHPPTGISVNNSCHSVCLWVSLCNALAARWLWKDFSVHESFGVGSSLTNPFNDLIWQYFLFGIESEFNPERLIAWNVLKEKHMHIELLNKR